jgi:hypothetical protein
VWVDLAVSVASKAICGHEFESLDSQEFAALLELRRFPVLPESLAHLIWLNQTIRLGYDVTYVIDRL